MNDGDARLLTEVLRYVEERHDDPDERTDVPYRAFKDMLDRGAALSDKQRAWVRSVHARLFDETTYENLVSSGRVPRGREVETPAILRDLPKKPPPRRTEED